MPFCAHPSPRSDMRLVRRARKVEYERVTAELEVTLEERQRAVKALREVRPQRMGCDVRCSDRPGRRPRPQTLLKRRAEVESEWLERLQAFDAQFAKRQEGLTRMSSQLVMRSPRTDRSVAL